MELWQLDLVHGFLLADGTSAKALTGQAYRSNRPELHIEWTARP